MHPVLNIENADKKTTLELLERLRKTAPKKYLRIIRRLEAAVVAEEAAAQALLRLVGKPPTRPS